MMKQYGQAELHMQVACELNPNDPWVAISAALLRFRPPAKRLVLFDILLLIAAVDQVRFR